MKKRLYVDVHCLQTVPPSCVNRDDTGSPKTSIYGGVTRARVSSQAWKKAVRDQFSESLPEEDTGVRTKKIVGLVQSYIQKFDPKMSEEEAEKKATDALTKAGLTIKNKETGTDALTLMSLRQAEKLAELAVNGETKKPEYAKAIKENPSVDMLLFGRMVASDPSLNYDACCQVAHAISTHAATTEYDYFTAVDDLGDADNAGASHIGVNEFNSSTLYRYANINVGELYRHLGYRTPEAVCAFIDAFVKTMPTGKENSYANRTLPCAVYVAIREDQPVSFAGAYEKAIPASSEGYEKESEKRLVDYAGKMYRDFVSEPFTAYAAGDGLDELTESRPFTEILRDVSSDLSKLLNDGE